MRRFILFYIFTVLFSVPTASANQKLMFYEAKSSKEEWIVSFLDKKLGKVLMAPEIARYDLNGDILDEYLIRYNCHDQNKCSYAIVAIQELEPILIGQFDAHKILISQKKTYGIHDLIVYNDNYNDYQNQTARWNPLSFGYQLD